MLSSGFSVQGVWGWLPSASPSASPVLPRSSPGTRNHVYSCPVPLPLPFPASFFPCLLPHLSLSTQLRWHLLQQAFSTPSGWCSSYKPHHTLRSPNHKAHYCVKSIKLSLGVAPPSQVSCLYCNLPLPNPFPVRADHQLPKIFSREKSHRDEELPFQGLEVVFVSQGCYNK